MEISRSDAAGALQDVELAQARSAERRGYHKASSYLILWGAVWAVGYALMAVRPASDWGLIWLPLDLIGMGGSVALAARDASAGRRPGVSGRPWRALAGGLFVAMFVAATYTVFAPQTAEPAIVFPGLVAGLIYGACGLIFMPRLAWIGFAMFVLTMAGFFFAHDWLLAWMAAVGGGGLIVGGVWLRSA